MYDFQTRRAILQDIRMNDELINGTIMTEDGGKINVHLEILAARSPYFKRIISKARGKAWKNVLIPGTSKDVVVNIIDFMYMGKLRLSVDKISKIVRTGELLEMPDIVKLCQKFLVDNLNAKDCICFYFFAKQCGYATLQEQIKSYTVLHFQEIFPVSDDYLDLSAQELHDILKENALNVKNEESVYWAVMRWFEKDPISRIPSLPSLIRQIRLGLIHPNFYERNIWPNPYLCNNNECQTILLQASQIFEDMPRDINESISNLIDARHPFLRPRIPSEVIFVMGGWSSGSAIDIIETYDRNADRWFLSLLPGSTPRAYHGMLWHQGYIYVIGGFDGNQCFNSVHRLDPVSRIWEERGCMYTQRCYISVAALGLHIYAMGGFDGRRRNSSCERYDPVTNQWTRLASMTHVRSDASADSLNGKIYIAGGFDGAHVLNTAEYYDPETDQWTQTAHMISPRSGVKMVAYCDHLYVVGGFNGQARLNTVEKYDPCTDTWSAVPSMQGPRSNFAITVMGGCIYAIGGYNGSSTIATAEYFDIQKNEWLKTKDLNLNRSAVAACTVSGISNVTEYTFLGNVSPT